MAKGKRHKLGGRKAVTSQHRMPVPSTPASATKSKAGGHEVLKVGGSGAGEVKSDQFTGISAKKETLTAQGTSSDTASLSEKKTSRKNTIFLLILVAWLFAYLGCESQVNAYLDYPADQSLVKDAVSKLRTVFNFVMAIAVLVATFCDRARIYREISFKSITDVEDALDSMFVPFALALVPFTSASVDFGESVASLSFALSLVMLFIAVITITDFALLSKYKLDTDKLYRFGKGHVQTIIISFFLFLLFGFNVFLDWYRHFFQ